jgi:hypothetical protein
VNFTRCSSHPTSLEASIYMKKTSNFNVLNINEFRLLTYNKAPFVKCPVTGVIMFNTFSAVHKTEQLSAIFCAVTRQTPIRDL